MLAANQVLHKGRYRIITQFGQDETGGMYEAYDTISNTNVVLRESTGRTGKIATPTQLEAINAEFAGGARVLADIKHESLVSVQDYFSEIDRQYLVLESVTGHDLTSFLEPSGPRPELAEVMSWADDLLNALHYLHRLLPPVIHRDIKPANIKLTSSLKVKLLTAGLPPPPFSDSVTMLPGQSWANASLCYKPLEHLWGGMDPASQRVILNSYDEKSAGVLLRPLDARSDLYSLAASLYHVLTGTAPDDALERSIAILDGKPDPLKKPSYLDRSIPPEISDALMRAMSIRRENRFDSAVIMQQVLRTASIRVAERESGASDGTPQTTNETIIETAEIQLELERTLAEERQREIEAEQARLDDERKRLDERRQELEAERERQLARREELEREAEQERKRIEREKLEEEAEIERKRVAQKLADLEAERSREQAEEKRLEREAEVERARAEKRLQALQAEQERHRAEQKRLEEEAKAELMRAEQRIKEISHSNLDLSDSTDDDFPLLELEPETLPNPGVSPSGVDVSVEPEAPSTAASFEVMAENSVAVDNDPTFSIYEEQTRTNWRVPIIAGAAALVIAAAVGVWQFMPSAGSAPAANPTQASFSAPQPQPEPEVTPTAESSPENSLVPEQEVLGDTGVQARQPQPNPDKQKKAGPTAVKPPAAKKKVTADDLINDN